MSVTKSQDLHGSAVVLSQLYILFNKSNWTPSGTAINKYLLQCDGFPKYLYSFENI
jgi:hypothetical protein